MPQGMSGPGATKDAEIHAEQEGMRPGLLGIVARHAPRQVLVSRGKRSQTVQGGPQSEMAYTQEPGVLLALGQGEELLAQFPRGLMLRPHGITGRQAPP